MQTECQECGMTYEVKPSTHMFFQMFLLWKSSGKDRWGREEGAGSESSSGADKQGQSRFSHINSQFNSTSSDLVSLLFNSPLPFFFFEKKGKDTS